MGVEMKIGNDGRLWVMGVNIGEVDKEVLKDEEVRKELKKLLMEERKRVRKVMRVDRMKRIEEKYKGGNV